MAQNRWLWVRMVILKLLAFPETIEPYKQEHVFFCKVIPISVAGGPSQHGDRGNGDHEHFTGPHRKALKSMDKLLLKFNKIQQRLPNMHEESLNEFRNKTHPCFLGHLDQDHGRQQITMEGAWGLAEGEVPVINFMSFQNEPQVKQTCNYEFTNFTLMQPWLVLQL